MTLSSSVVLSAPRDRVFGALVDPDVLRRLIPGCEDLEPVGEDVFEARLNIGVAGVKGTYTGRAELRDKLPPQSLKLVFEGKGGPGFVRGTAAIRLTEEDAQTRVACDADVQVGGLMAAVGSRLIEAAARKLTDDFFRELAAQVAQDPVSKRS